MKKFQFLFFAVGLLQVIGQAQILTSLDAHNQDKWVPAQVGAHYFLPKRDHGRLLKGVLEMAYPSRHIFLVFKKLDEIAASLGANAYHPDAISFDSTSGNWVWSISLFAMNRFDIDKLPVPNPGLYLLNPLDVGNGKPKLGNVALASDLPGVSSLDIEQQRFYLKNDTFVYISPFQGLVVYLDGPMGSKYKWINRPLTSDFVFSAKGASNLVSYRTKFTKKNGIYVSLRSALGHWFLFDYGLEWWENPLTD